MLLDGELLGIMRRVLAFVQSGVFKGYKGKYERVLKYILRSGLGGRCDSLEALGL